MDKFLDEFGKRVREHREYHKLSQETLAGLINVSTNTIVAWESGKSFIRRESLAELCRVLQISEYDLFSRPVEKYQIEKGSVLEQIFLISKNLKINKQKQILEILKTFQN